MKTLAPGLAAIAPQRRGEHHWFYKGQKVPQAITGMLPQELKRREEKSYRAERDAKWSPKSQVDAMHRLGLDISYLYPSKGLQLWAFRETVRVDDLISLNHLLQSPACSYGVTEPCRGFFPGTLLLIDQSGR